MKHEEIVAKLKEIIESKPKLNLDNSSSTDNDREKLSKFISEIAYDCFVEGYNAAINKVNKELNK